MRRSGYDASTVSLTALTHVFSDAFALFDEIVRQPSFPQAEVERVRAKAIGDLALSYSSPSALARFVAQRVAFGSAPYGHPVAGTAETLAALDRDRIVAFHARFFRPDNATLIIGGDLRARRCVCAGRKAVRQLARAGRTRAGAGAGHRAAAAFARRDRRQTRCRPHGDSRRPRRHRAARANVCGGRRRDGRAFGLQRPAQSGSAREARALVRRRRAIDRAPRTGAVSRLDAGRSHEGRRSGDRGARYAARSCGDGA